MTVTRPQLELPEVDFNEIVERTTESAKYVRILALFTLLSTLSTFFMWNYVGWAVLVQIAGIVLVAVFGESIVSSQGYYQYPKKHDNGPFIRNVPIWIPFLWIFTIQTSFLTGLVFGLSGIQACVLSGLITVAFDLIFLEPYFSRQKELWIWDSVEGGYFKFIPKQLDMFTAPPGNYITWVIFPIIMNYGTILVSLILQ